MCVVSRVSFYFALVLYDTPINLFIICFSEFTTSLFYIPAHWIHFIYNAGGNITFSTNAILNWIQLESILFSGSNICPAFDQLQYDLSHHHQTWELIYNSPLSAQLNLRINLEIICHMENEENIIYGTCFYGFWKQYKFI